MKRSRAADFLASKKDESESEGVEESEGETRLLREDKSDESDVPESDDEDEGRTSIKRQKVEAEGEGDDEGEGEEGEEEEKSGFKVLTKEEVEQKQKQIKKTGVVYISRIPPFMKPEKMRQVLGRFGKVDRIFLAPEDPKIRERRIKYGGNRKKTYTEGWAEFLRKKDAKLAAETLNGNPIGGKKHSFYHDDILNVKYLHKFKWHDLTEQITREQQSRQEKMRAEIAQATRENKSYIANVERAKMIKGIQEKRGTKDDTVRRTFDQRSTTTKRTDSSKPVNQNEKMNSVLNKIL